MQFNSMQFNSMQFTFMRLPPTIIFIRQRLLCLLQGDIFENVFSLSTSKNGSITGVFRTVCSGSIVGNTGLPSSQVENANPSAAG